MYALQVHRQSSTCFHGLWRIGPRAPYPTQTGQMPCTRQRCQSRMLSMYASIRSAWCCSLACNVCGALQKQSVAQDVFFSAAE